MSDQGKTPPPFEVPWGTVQRDSRGDIWRFFDEESSTGHIAVSAGKHWSKQTAAKCAPFTRLYTVQELTDIYEKLGDHDMVERLAFSAKDGDI